MRFVQHRYHRPIHIRGVTSATASLTEFLHPDAMEQALLERQAHRASLDAAPRYQRRRLFAPAIEAAPLRPVPPPSRRRRCRSSTIISMPWRGLLGLQGRQTLGGISEVCNELRSCGGSLWGVGRRGGVSGKGSEDVETVSRGKKRRRDGAVLGAAGGRAGWCLGCYFCGRCCCRCGRSAWR